MTDNGGHIVPRWLRATFGLPPIEDETLDTMSPNVADELIRRGLFKLTADGRLVPTGDPSAVVRKRNDDD